jgi:hypothetical protein
MDDSIPRLAVYHLISPRWTGILVVMVLASLILHQATIFFGGDRTTDPQSRGHTPERAAPGPGVRGGTRLRLVT